MTTVAPHSISKANSYKGKPRSLKLKAGLHTFIILSIEFFLVLPKKSESKYQPEINPIGNSSLRTRRRSNMVTIGNNGKIKSKVKRASNLLLLYRFDSCFLSNTFTFENSGDTPFINKQTKIKIKKIVIVNDSKFTVCVCVCVCVCVFT